MVIDLYYHQQSLKIYQLQERGETHLRTVREAEWEVMWIDECEGGEVGGNEWWMEVRLELLTQPQRKVGQANSYVNAPRGLIN